MSEDMSEAIDALAEQAGPVLGWPVDDVRVALFTAMNTERPPLKVFGVVAPPRPSWWRRKARRKWRADLANSIRDD